MPELPEVETICRAIRPHVIGRTITGVQTCVPRLRHPLDQDALSNHLVGRRIHDIRRRGKYIILELDDGGALVIHLGMTGSFRICPPEEPLHRHDRLVWTLSDGQHWRFQDIRRFGMAVICHLAKPGAEPTILAHLGPEPLGVAFTADYLIAAFKTHTRPIKNALLDQRLVAGLGNIYVNEALFDARISPLRPSDTLTRAECERLIVAVKKVLSASLESGGTTISDFKSVDGSEGKFALHLSVYGRENLPCPRCGSSHTIRRLVQAGRASFHCPGCQR